MGPHCSPLHNELGLGVMDRSGRMIDTTHDAGYLGGFSFGTFEFLF